MSTVNKYQVIFLIIIKLWNCVRELPIIKVCLSGYLLSISDL